MTYDQIAAKLAGKLGAAQLDDLQRECAPRQQEIRTRLLEITDGLTTPPARAKAILTGLAAVEILDREVEALRREHALLDALEQRIVDARETALREKYAAEIPVARKSLPRLVSRAKAALAALDAAIAEIDAAVAVVGEYGRIPGAVFPLDDGELAALLALREDVWKQRSVLVLTPRSGETHPVSWSRYFEPASYDTYRPRRPGVPAAEVLQ